MREKQDIDYFTTVNRSGYQRKWSYMMSVERSSFSPLQQNKTALFKHSPTVQAARSEAALCYLRKME